MRARTSVLVAVLACVAAVPAPAQERVVVPGEALGLHRDTLDAAAPQLRPFVLPESLVLLLDGVPVDPARVRLDVRTGTLRLVPPPPPGAELVAVYRTLAFEELFPLRGEAAETGGVEAPVSAERGPVADAVPGLPSGLRRSGAIRRGVVLGNRRDASLESGLRLELEGELVDGVTVRAVLSDEQVPLQPDGSTQRLAELDRVFVELATRGGEVRLGDVDLLARASPFAALDRRGQGAVLTAELPARGGLAGGRIRAAAAVARGLFRSQDLVPLDGVQGPYRLTGAQGEELIVVLAGSERVYVDGERMVRGEAHDYVIDYGTGEITFTPRRLITADRRITVDFEYTTGAPSRTLLASEAAVGLAPDRTGRARATVEVALLREADGPAFAELHALSEADLDLIAAAGVGQPARSGAERVPFDAQSAFVLYARRDTTVAGQTFEVFVPARPDDPEVYRVRFSRVEPGTGQYVRAGRTLNGVVFEWVGPTGGDYVPLRLLPRPERRALASLRAAAEPIRGLEVVAEVARSGLDRNRLSDLAATEQEGGAYRATLRLAPTELAGGTVAVDLDARVREAAFTPFGRVRPVEFNRAWNLARAGSGLPGLDTLREASTEAMLVWARPSGTRVGLEAGRLELGNGLTARRGALALEVREGAWPHLAYRAELADADGDGLGEEGTWLRQRARLGVPLAAGVEPFVVVEQERRAQRVRGVGALAPTSFAFAEVRPGVAVRRGVLEGALAVGLRAEDAPEGDGWVDGARALTVAAEGRWTPSRTFATEAEAALRRRTVRNPLRARGEDDTESVALRWTTRWAAWARAVELTTLYRATSERAPVLQEVFVRVGPELGEYVWEDLNGDGLQQLDEFRRQLFPLEGEYVRMLVPGDALRPAAHVQAQVRLHLEPGRALDRMPPGWAWLRAVSGFTVLELQDRSEGAAADVYLLRPSGLLRPETTLGGRFRVAQELAVLRGHPVVDGRLGASHLRTVVRLATGTEERTIQRLEGEGRVRVSDPLTLRLRLAGERHDAASALPSRTFALRATEAEPEATFRPTQAIVLSAGVRVAARHDLLSERMARLLVVPVRARLGLAEQLDVLLSGERADVWLAGPPAAGELLFELTQQRGVGTSYLWGGALQAALGGGLRASAHVEGRTAPQAPPVVTVRAQLSAVF